MSNVAIQQYELGPARVDLGKRIVEALRQSFPTAALSLAAEDVGRLLEVPPDTALGDYALPCFRFAKDLKTAPPQIAGTLAQQLTPGGWLAKAESVGAFLNLSINRALLATTVLKDHPVKDTVERLAATPGNTARRVMIEYSQPNTHKELHVGHLRNMCLGNALVRLFRACGYQIMGANYFGDDGTHIATVLWYIQKNRLSPPDGVSKGEWLGQLYTASKQAVEKASPEDKVAFQAEISQIHRQIETRTGPSYDLWKETRQWSLDAFDQVYRWMDIAFDVLFYESDMTDEAQAIVDEYHQKGLFVLDQGAIGADLKPHKLGFCIVRKSDGNTLYATKDLALARRKFDLYKVDRAINVVGAEQIHHFRQVFKILDLMGFPQAKHCYHLSYGLVMLPEGKMSSRDGTTVPFAALRAEMMEHLEAKLAKYQGEWSPAEIEETAHRLCAGAIKYGMISTDPSKEIVFNMEDWLSFEGNSGPYLMYSYSRSMSILRKAAELGYYPDPTGAAHLVKDSEQDVLRLIYGLSHAVAVAAESYQPSHLATHLYYMCKALNRLYVEVSVLKAENDTLRGARLALIESFAKALQWGLSLLGMVPPERM